MEVTGRVDNAQYLEQAKRAIDAAGGRLGPFIEALWKAYGEERTIFLIGNGGSAANASHFGHDLCKGTLPDLSVTKRFRALPLTDSVPFITALGNDAGYESIFVEQLKTFGKPGDVLVVFSGSGNSANVLRAAEYANGHGMTTIGLTGYDGGRLGKLAAIHVNVPVDNIGMAEAVHGILIHAVLTQLTQRLVTSSLIL